MGRSWSCRCLAGVGHDVWGANMAPRLVQPVTDADFEVEAKFESTRVGCVRDAGCCWSEQDADDYLRFDVYGNGGQVYLFAARTVGGSPTALLNTSIPASGDPVFLRVGRVGDVWTLSYSVDGSSWVTAVSFEHSLVASSVGVFVGNAGGAPPAHTAVVDYVFNTSQPILPEDVQAVTC